MLVHVPKTKMNNGGVLAIQNAEEGTLLVSCKKCSTAMRCPTPSQGHPRTAASRAAQTHIGAVAAGVPTSLSKHSKALLMNSVIGKQLSQTRPLIAAQIQRHTRNCQKRTNANVRRWRNEL